MFRKPEKQGVFSKIFQPRENKDFNPSPGTFAELHMSRVQNPGRPLPLLFTAKCPRMG
ncbi:hypothetical protein [Leisingera caerulea]|uniref:Uncharacterized protein n=1 Tax=Leisingera caerulea TaxID=506591 RepID=A0A9Q9M241_LEICA|nr:hypothetical protein [Leisingera caerulea]UWQ53169.1 hypothetical protein K3721_14320 [Leisingera caerulea]